MTETRINDLHSKMSLEEKIGQLIQPISRDPRDLEIIRQGKAVVAFRTPKSLEFGV